MPDWIAKARKSVSREAPAEPVPFRRACLCGEPLSGQRDGLAQEIHCPACGRNWFVLPRDAYPWPKVRRPKATARVRSSLSRWSRRTRKDGKTPSTRTAPPADAATNSNTEPSSLQRQQPPGTQTATKSASAPTTLPITPPWHQRLRAKIKRAARPIRLVVGGMAAIILLTGIWLWYQDRLADAADTLGKAVPAAEAAIDAGDLPTAALKMGRAARAVDILGANDQEARRIRQRHRELVTILGLASLTPFDLAAQAALANDNPNRWSRSFAASYAGKWVILDVPLGAPRPAIPRHAPVAKKPLDDKADQPKDKSSGEQRQPPPAETVIPLLLPLKAGEVPVRFALESARFEELLPPDRAILALQYKSWTMLKDEAGNPVWVVRFEPRTAFPWTSIDLYQAAGFNTSDPVLPVKKQLAQQAQQLESRL